MAIPSWKMSGQYYETCNCDFGCPCIFTQMTATPSKGACTFAMAFQIAQGHFGALSLDGLGFLIVGSTPQEIGRGNWSAGVIIDERANAEQRDAIAAVATGAAGGPMGVLAGMITKFLGVEQAPIRFEQDGVRWRVEASTLARIGGMAAFGLGVDTHEPLKVCNTGHPANTDITLAHATESKVSAFGLSWSDTSGRNNGQYAPFSWAGA